MRFHERRGFAPLPQPLPQLYAPEPEDVHLPEALIASGATRPTT